ncbi:nascent polypeptide-associated complex subunit alpha, muscle-specific form-like [Lathamus discolor]|uniref:nascent polypeptide-associated complex subunit alpha, muscle-specific form-like n=1 Tax=Lathamus discolor TaxID=678569 RepID=UPI0032B7171F
MVVLQELENVLSRLGSFPRSHAQEKRDEGQALLFLSPPEPTKTPVPEGVCTPTGDRQRWVETEGRRFEPGSLALFPVSSPGPWRSRGGRQIPPGIPSAAKRTNANTQPLADPGTDLPRTPRHSPAHARHHAQGPAQPPPAPLPPPLFKAGSATPVPLARVSSHLSRLGPHSGLRLRPCSRPERVQAAGPPAATGPAGAEPRPQGGEATQPPHLALPLPAAPPPPPAAAILGRKTRDTHPAPRPGGANRAPTAFNVAPAGRGRRRCKGLPSASMGQDELLPPQRPPHLGSCVLRAVIYSLKHNHKPLFVPSLWAVCPVSFHLLHEFPTATSLWYNKTSNLSSMCLDFST